MTDNQSAMTNPTTIDELRKLYRQCDVSNNQVEVLSEDEFVTAIGTLLMQARIDELEIFQWNDVHLYIHNRIAELNKQQEQK